MLRAWMAPIATCLLLQAALLSLLLAADRLTETERPCCTPPLVL